MRRAFPFVTSKNQYFLLFMMVWVWACSPTPTPTPLLELMPPEQTGIHFTNQLQEDENLNIFTFEYFYNGAGVGIGDFNGDSLQDLFFTSNMGNCSLYLNRGNFTFEDITEKAGIHTQGKWATGVSIIDINQDHLPDIYICFSGPWQEPQKRANELYINNGNNTFTEQAATYGLADTGHSVQAAFLDYDLDGDLDMYLLTNMTDKTGPNIIRPKRILGEMLNTDRLYRNNGNLTFTNVSPEVGITIEGYGLGLSITDINLDGWPDIYISNDYLSNDLLYFNNQDGTFTNRADRFFQHTSYSAMGNDVSDFNNDGKADLITLDMLPPDNFRQKMMLGVTPYDRYRSELQYGYAPQFMRNTLQLNQGFSPKGDLVFSEIGQLAGIQATDWSWSALWADLDNDGWRDLIITNGYPKDITNRDFASYKAQELMSTQYNEPMQKRMLRALNQVEGAYLPNFVFQNRKEMVFKDQSENWGFTQPSYSTGAAYTDLDNDGDLDLVMNNTDQPAFIYQNHTETRTKNHYLKISLTGPSNNLRGIGAKVYLFASGHQQYQENYPVRGFQSTVEGTMHFGLGNQPFVDSLMVKWPDGNQQVLPQTVANQILHVDYKNSSKPSRPLFQTKKEPLFRQARVDYNIAFRHQESHYADFKIQPLLPQKYSQNGPGIAVGDMNGDGREDFFVGGAFKQSGQLMFQQADGSFRSWALTTETKYEEDMGALLFDADQDEDLDLYIVSGGSEFPAGSKYYQDRLYFNNGRGDFSWRPDALPTLYASGSCAIAADYDQDGDLDLFVGGRLTPNQYPDPGESQLLENRNGHFVDVTVQVAPDLKNIGMVTAALWTDVDNDHHLDLMVVGEWMPVTIFQNQNGKFTNITEKLGLSATQGWWNSLQAADFDQDGDTDYVLGNLGLNSRYKTSREAPLQAYVYDFNADGSKDAVLSYYQEGKSYPLHPRDDMFQQLISLKKKFPLYADYAKATIQDLFSEELLSKATVLTSQTFASGYLENKGADKWQMHDLPIEAQFAPVFGLLTGDYDGDNFPDVLLTGNSYATEVQTGRYDALHGVFLKGDGQGNFKTENNEFFVTGDAKSLAELNTSQQKPLLLAAINDDTLQVLEAEKYPEVRVPIMADDAYALVTFEDVRRGDGPRGDGQHGNGPRGNEKKVKYEFYYGAGYLSQSSRMLRLPATVKEVIVYNFKGEARKLPSRQVLF